MMGQVAEDQPPKWLITRMQNGELEVNILGGFCTQSPFGYINCAAGDYVILNEDDTIEFIKAEVFEDRFSKVDPKDILKAA